MLLHLLAIWVGWSRRAVISTLLNSHGVSHTEVVTVLGPTDVVIVFGWPAFSARGNWKEQCQKFWQVKRWHCSSGCPGEAAEFSQESAAFSLGCEGEIRSIWKAQMEGREPASGAPGVGIALKFRELPTWHPLEA